MRVVFLDNVEGTAQVGEVKEVKNGFARNYLLPRGLAAPAVEPYLQRARAQAEREAKKQEGLDRDAAVLAEQIAGSRVTIEARVGEQGKLYGSVTSVHIAEEVGKVIGEEFDHRKVLLPEAIKEVGVQPVRLRLTRNVEATIEVAVVPEGGEAALEQPPAEEEEEAEGTVAQEQPEPSGQPAESDDEDLSEAGSEIEEGDEE